MRPRKVQRLGGSVYLRQQHAQSVRMFGVETVQNMIEAARKAREEQVKRQERRRPDPIGRLIRRRFR